MCLQRDCHDVKHNIWYKNVDKGLRLLDLGPNDITSRNTENILVFLGPREKSKFESTAFANTLLCESNSN